MVLIKRIKNRLLIHKIVPKLLDLVKDYQEGSGTEKVHMGTFNFTEGWFRTIFQRIIKYQNTYCFLMENGINSF